MRFLQIAALLLCIQLSASVINAVGTFHPEYQPMTEWYNDTGDQRLANSTYVVGQLSTSTTELGWGDFVKGLFFFVTALGWGIVSVPYTLSNFGIRAPFEYFFSTAIYFIYLIALAQFISNRGTKGMD